MSSDLGTCLVICLHKTGPSQSGHMKGHAGHRVGSIKARTHTGVTGCGASVSLPARLPQEALKQLHWARVDSGTLPSRTFLWGFCPPLRGQDTNCSVF